VDVEEYVRQSNLIEGVDDEEEDIQSMRAWGFLESKNKVDIKTLLELHRLITTNQLSVRDAGSFRSVSVQVGGQICPDPSLAQGLIYNWLEDMRQFWKALDPIKMHVRFEKIHPFIDGNGRTGRMLLWWLEIKQGDQPTLFWADEKREKYYPLFGSHK